MPPLRNARQERFVHELVKGRTHREAYVLAGYKVHDGMDYRLRRNPAVIRRYEELAGAAAHRAEVTGANVISEIAAIAFANLGDYLTLDADGKPQTDLSKLTREQTAAMVEVSSNSRGVRIRLADKLEALVHLGKMLGLFRERVELSGANGGPVETREIDDFEAARRIAFILARAEYAAKAQEDAGGHAESTESAQS